MSKTLDFTERNKTVDLIRALTMFLMLFVNELPCVRAGIPHWMVHAAVTEDFMGLSDFVFPTFLFVMGLSIPYAIEKRLAKGHSLMSTLVHILSRTVALLIMGVFYVNMGSGFSEDMVIGKNIYKILMICGFFMIWNAWPKNCSKKAATLHKVLKIAGSVLLAWLMFIYKGPQDECFRTQWWGILGLLGWAYLMCACLYLAFRTNILKHALAWVVFLLISIVEADHLLPSDHALETIMKLFFIQPGTRICWCMGGVITTLAVLRTADWKPSLRLLTALGTSAVFAIIAWALHHQWIFSKNLETPPTLFLCIAVDILAYILLDIICNRGWDKFFKPIMIAGSATLSCYIIHVLVRALHALTPLPQFSPWDGIGGVIFCIGYAGLVLAVTYGLTKLHIKLKI